MRLALLRRDYAIIMLPCVWFFGGLMGYVFARSNTADRLRYGLEYLNPNKTFFDWLLIQAVMAAMYYFMLARMHEIASPFRMTLPVSTRELWGTRMFAMLASVVGGALLCCLCYALSYGLPLDRIQVTLAFNAICLVALLPFLYHCVRIRTGTFGMPLPIYAVLLVGLVWTYTRIGLRTVTPGVVSLVLAAALGGVTWFRLPPNFELRVRNLDLGPRLADAVACCFAWTDHVPVLRSFVRFDRALSTGEWLTRQHLVVLLSCTTALGVFALYGSLLSILFVLVLAQLVLFARSVNGGFRVAHLPIPRARVFHHGALPGLLGGWLAAGAVVSCTASLGWRDVLSSKACAFVVLLHVVTWKNTLAILVSTMRTPPSSRRAWRLRHLTNPHLWSTGSLAALLVGTELVRRFLSESSSAQSFLPDLAGLIPVGATALWLIALCGAAGLYLALCREYLQTESQPHPRGLES